ncbi:CHAT domain-containing protein [Mycena maculata]|uniref:CHAT domain-containing protein n=1 Tax=Mycena maculata TaxID=230809 RepID=A0AAD7N9S2_9AGAR|nr:CHAT domain-containing protein [Mycena maculata]
MEKCQWAVVSMCYTRGRLGGIFSGPISTHLNNRKFGTPAARSYNITTHLNGKRNAHEAITRLPHSGLWSCQIDVHFIREAVGKLWLRNVRSSAYSTGCCTAMSNLSDSHQVLIFLTTDTATVMPPSELRPDDRVRTPSDSELRAKTQIGMECVLGIRFFKKYQEAGDAKDLGVAVRLFQGIVDRTPAEHPSRAGQLRNLAVCLTARYQRSGNLQDLEAALQRNQEMVELTPADHPERAYMLQSLALSFTDWYQRLGNLEDLEDAVQKMQEAVNLTPVDHPERAGRLQSLTVSLTDRYRRLGTLEDLEATVQKMQQAVDFTLVDHPDRAGRLQSLAVSLGDRYKRLGALYDLETSLQRMQEAVDLTLVDHPERAGRLQSLAVFLGDRYQRLGALDDMEASLQRLQEARLGALEDLEATLQKMQEAIDLTPVEHPDKARRVQGLAVALRDRYQRLGALDDLEASLQRKQEAVDLTPVDHPDRVGRLQSLARLGALDDLEASLQRKQEALDLTPVDHPDRGGRLQSLAVSLSDRYCRLGALEDLETALQKMQEAVDLTPVDHPERAGRLQDLAVSLTDRYHRLGVLADLEASLQKRQKAVDLTPTDQEAVDLTPVDHPDKAGRLQSLAVSLGHRYQRLGALADLEATVQKMQETVDLTPVDHPDMAGRLQNLAVSFRDRYHKFQRPQDLDFIHRHYSDSFNTLAPSDPEPSWRAALGWASFLQEFHPVNCCKAYSAAFNLLPELLWMGHTIPIRQDAIRRLGIGHTASAAARACIGLSDLISAVQFIEQGLATTFQQMLQLKPDLHSLPLNLADTLQKLSYALYSGTSTNPSKVAYERNRLIQDIPSHEGPVVILNSHENGCDGIIIVNPTSGPVHVVLPNVTLALLKAQQKNLEQLLNRCNARTRGDLVSTRLFSHREGFRYWKIEECFSELLTWLWDNIVDPAYQVLASSHSMGFTVEDYGSLLEARIVRTASVPYKVGVVGVTHTGPGNSYYLKGVELEVEKISSVIMEPNLECLEGEQATPDAVKNLLQNCSWVHLACHGKQNLREPIKTHLSLYNGMLELETILQMPLSNPEFVFLAACQTAMGDVDLVNESFHLGGGFIAAGFRGAIGTLWSMNDEDGPLVAETFYSHLFQDGKRPQVTDAAEALHLAVRKLREKKVPYERWIPFIHMGV